MRGETAEYFYRSYLPFILSGPPSGDAPAETVNEKLLYKKDDLKYYPQIINSPVFQGVATPDSKHSQKREEK
jgi:hypothetical protein